jgi:hypothetical protein
MKIAVETAHLTVVSIPEKGVERGSNQGKVGNLSLAYTPGAQKIFVYKRIPTKCNARVGVKTSDRKIVELSGLMIRQP